MTKHNLISKSVIFIAKVHTFTFSTFACLYICVPFFYQSLAEQIHDIENVCGQFPSDAYFLHGGKTVSISCPSLGILRRSA